MKEERPKTINSATSQNSEDEMKLLLQHTRSPALSPHRPLLENRNLPEMLRDKMAKLLTRATLANTVRCFSAGHRRALVARVLGGL